MNDTTIAHTSAECWLAIWSRYLNHVQIFRPLGRIHVLRAASLCASDTGHPDSSQAA